jgi:hypothetical protein
MNTHNYNSIKAFKILLLLLIFPSLLLSQESLKDYINNDFYYKSVKEFSSQGNIDSSYFYASKIFESNDKTFWTETYYQLAILHQNKTKKCPNIVLPSKKRFNKYLICKYDQTKKSLQYLDTAVKYGLIWSDIDLDYDSLRYAKYRHIYEETFYNEALIKLLTSIGKFDQGNRNRYNGGEIPWTVVAKQDSINCSRLKNWVHINGWPPFLSQRNKTMSAYEYEKSSLSTYISHYGRENVLYFLDNAYNSALEGKSSWNQVYEILLFLYWKFPEEILMLDENKRYYVSLSPISYIYTEENSGIINIEDSMFAILGLAESAQNLQLLVLPSKKYYSNHPDIAFTELRRIKNICSSFNVSISYFPIFQLGGFGHLKKIIETENYESEFYLVFFNFEDYSFSYRGVLPSVINKSKITKDDIDSIFKK